jgi:hypothetical protein
MYHRKPRLGQILLGSSIAFFVLHSFSSAATITHAPSATASSTRHPTSVQASRPSFSDVGRPRRRQGGGSRGACLVADKPPLTALVPDSSTGYTLAQSPSFWFYLPYRLGEGHTLEFVLKDSQDNLVHSKTIAGSDTASGIVNLRLPNSVTLETNQSYEWYLLVQCDATNPERFVFVNGAIQRLEQPELQQQLANLDPASHADLYMTEEIWYDAVDTIAAQIQTAPQNDATRESWAKLLQTIGLPNLATEPITLCCTAE